MQTVANMVQKLHNWPIILGPGQKKYLRTTKQPIVTINKYSQKKSTPELLFY